MHCPQVIVLENEGIWSGVLQRVPGRRWLMRTARHAEEVQEHLPPGAEVVVIVELTDVGRGHWELLPWLTRRRPQCPVIGIVGDQDDTLALRAWQAGCLCVVPKSIAPQRLLDLVETLIAWAWPLKS
ncbi:MAG: hypothetical protein C4296_09065 [Gemmataceae bacterium]